jgi:hypothetical protein
MPYLNSAAARAAACVLAMALFAGCAGQGSLGPTAPDPLAENTAGLTGLPALPGTDNPASPFRQLSDTPVVQVLGDGAAGNSGNVHIDPGTHTLTLVPGGEDELSWAVFTLPGLDSSRPASLGLNAVSLFPGGEDELNYWVYVSNYSTGRWSLVGGPNGDKSFSSVTIDLNSPTMRDRVVSVKGAGDPTFSFAVVTRGNSFNSTGKAWDAQPRVEISTADTTLRDVTDAAYVSTKPAYIPLSGAATDGAGAAQSVNLTWTNPADPVNGGVNEAQSFEIFRQRVGDSQAERLGEVNAPASSFTDPDDNEGDIAGPVAGEQYIYTVHGKNAAGSTVSSSLPIYVGGWSSPVVVDATTPNANASLAMVNGMPALACVEASTNRIKYARATAVNGSVWSPAVLAGSATVKANACCLLALGNNLPAIAYYDATDLHLKFIRASDASGASWAAPQTIDGSGIAGAFASACLIDGNPAVSYYDVTGGQLKFARATNGDGTVWSMPVVVDNSSAFTGQYTSLAEVAGRPAISYYDSTAKDLKYVLANDNHGNNWAAAPLTLDATGDTGRATSLTIISGRPAIGYFDASLGKLKFLLSNDPAGTAWGAPVEVADMGSAAAFTSLGLVSGLPAISFSAADGSLRVAQATDANGEVWKMPVIADGTATLAGSAPLLSLGAAGAAIGYCDGASGELRTVALF